MQTLNNPSGTAQNAGQDIPKAAAPLLELRQVSRTFSVRQGLLAPQAELRAVDGVDLVLHSGEPLGLVGESGCGKSTLGRIAVGLLPPSSGEVLLEGQPLAASTIASNKNDNTRGSLQMIFQDPFSSLNPRLPIGLSIAEPLTVRGIPKAPRREAVDEMLRLVGLSPAQATLYPHEFSGGQRQRIAVARALITRPQVIVCDEPVSALDASVQAQVLNLLRDVQERFNPAYLFISHDLAVVGFLCSRIAVMYLGKIVELAPRDDLFDRPAHPYTQALLAAMPSHDPARRAAPTPLGGELPSPLNPPDGCAFHPRCPEVMDICRTTPPPWRELRPGHCVRCYL